MPLYVFLVNKEGAALKLFVMPSVELSISLSVDTAPFDMSYRHTSTAPGLRRVCMLGDVRVSDMVISARF